MSSLYAWPRRQSHLMLPEAVVNIVSRPGVRPAGSRGGQGAHR